MNRLMRRLCWRVFLPVAWALLFAVEVQALPGFFATQTDAKTTSAATQVAVLMNGEDTVVTLMTDYSGPNKPFALVLPVPKDVQLGQVKVLKRGALERIDELTAPRFHEFWEMDPCEPGKAEQIWQQDLTATSSTDFLGGAKMFEGGEKAPKEMRTPLDTDYRDAGHEYTIELVASDLAAHLRGKGLKIPPGVNVNSLKDYSFLVAHVDPKKAEVGGQGELLLSPIRYATKTKLRLLSTLGLAHSDGAQELILFVLHPDKRMEVKGYENIFPPTNLAVDFKVKEKMGDFYAALHDQVSAKNPGAFLTEFVWDAQGCGEPCPDAPLRINELLTLGADVVELSVPEAEKNPKPPVLTAEQEEQLKALGKDERKKKEEMWQEVARRKALFARHDDYVLTRLHHRYNKKTLPKDLELVPAAPTSGGIDIPKGANGELPQGVQPASTNRFQTRFVHLHPNKTVVKCENPENYRWGKPPATYRGARKIWVADQLASRNRTRIKPADVVLTAVPALGISGVAAAGAEKKANDTPAVPPPASGSQCDCAVPGHNDSNPAPWLGLGALGLLAMSRRRR